MHIDTEPEYIGLDGYTHYEQGLDVAWYINSQAIFPQLKGQNEEHHQYKGWLSEHTREGILKHAIVKNYVSENNLVPTMKYLKALFPKCVFYYESQK